jgi:hypothetical protein
MPIGGSVGGEKGCSLPVAGPRYFSLRKPGELRRTRDIGIKGVFVICDTLPPVGTALSLEVYLPPLERNTMQRLHLEAAGKVIRVDVGGGIQWVCCNRPFALHKWSASHHLDLGLIRMEA